MRNPNEIVADALAAIQACPDLPTLEQVKAAYLGKSGQLTELLKSLGAMPAEERKTAGARINALRGILRSKAYFSPQVPALPYARFRESLRMRRPHSHTRSVT